MNEISSNNIWWKLEDSWKKIAKTLPWVFIPFIGIGLVFLLTFLLIIINVRLVILSIILIEIVIFSGLIPYFIILANNIGNAIKLFKIKKTLPEDSKYRKIFPYYLVGFFAPVVGPIFWSKAINNIMEYIGTQTSIQENIDYVEKRGKIYAILGTILWVTFWSVYIFYYVMTFLSMGNKVVFTRAFVEFLFIFSSILGVTMLILGIIMVAIQIGIINRLTETIHKSGLY